MHEALLSFSRLMKKDKVFYNECMTQGADRNKVAAVEGACCQIQFQSGRALLTKVPLFSISPPCSGNLVVLQFLALQLLLDTLLNVNGVMLV